MGGVDPLASTSSTSPVPFFTSELDDEDDGSSGVFGSSLMRS